MYKSEFDKLIVNFVETRDSRLFQPYEAFSNSFFSITPIFLNNEIFTKRAFRYYVIMSVFEIGLVRNMDLFQMKPKEGFKYVSDIVDESFIALTSQNFNGYKQNGAFNPYDVNKLPDYVKVVCDMFEKLCFGDYSSDNRLMEVDENIRLAFQRKILAVSFILNGVFDAYSYSNLYDVVKAAVDKENDNFDSLPLLLFGAKFEDDDLGLIDNEGDFNTNLRVHFIAKLYTTVLHIPEPVIRVTENEGNWLTLVESRGMPFIFANRTAIEKYENAYEFVYDVGKAIGIYFALLNKDTMLANLFDNCETVDDQVRYVEAYSELLAIGITNKLFNCQVGNRLIMVTPEYKSLSSAVSKDKRMMQTLDELKKAIDKSGIDITKDMINAEGFEYNRYEDFESLFDLM